MFGPETLQWNLYISIASGPGDAILLSTLSVTLDCHSGILSQ